VKDKEGLRPSVIDPGTPEFPVKIGDVGAVHAAFLTESRTRGGRIERLPEIQVRALARTWGTPTGLW
jgi:hypothetical protein